MFGTAIQPRVSLQVGQYRKVRGAKSIDAVPDQPRTRSSRIAAEDIFASVLMLALAVATAAGVAWLGRDLLSQLSSMPIHGLPRVLSGM